MGIYGIPVIVSEAIHPEEFVLHGTHNSVRWTPDGGIEELSEYQRQCIAAIVALIPPK